MYNQNQDEDREYDFHNYSPNELAELSISNPSKYKEIVESNLNEDDSINSWEQRNLQNVKRWLKR